MNKKFLLKMKEQLISEKQDLLKQIVKEIDVDIDGDETDEIQGKLLIQLTNQLNNRNSTKLAQIDAALKRIEEQSYGLCIDCGEAIADKRLTSNPYFQTCIFCAEEREIEEKQRRKN